MMSLGLESQSGFDASIFTPCIHIQKLQEHFFKHANPFTLSLILILPRLYLSLTK